jgi:hypothetical protein
MGRLSGIIALGIGALLALAPAPGAGDVLSNTVTIADPTGSILRGFASRVATAGDNILVTAPNGGFVPPPGPGQAYLFDAEGDQLSVFYSPGGGTSIGSIGSDVLIGSIENQSVARYDSTGAYIRSYDRPTSNPFGVFGHSIAALGSNIVIGDTATVGWTEGRAYLIDGVTGAILLTLADPNPDPYHFSFGYAVAVLGDDILVGRLNTEVHLFDGATGALIRTFSDPAGPPADPLAGGFGTAMAVAGNDVLIGNYLFNGTTGALVRTFAASVLGPVALLGDKVILGSGVFDRATGELLQTLPGSLLSLASTSSKLIVGREEGTWPALSRSVAVYESGCVNTECDPNTDTCCNPTTCRFDKCDPSVDPCCSASTCDFAQCSPGVDPCCDPDTCNFKPTNAQCVLKTGANAGCRTGTCNASHVCTGSGAFIANDTVCVAPQNPCFAGECDNGVCLPPNGSGTPFDDRCEDGNLCTLDAPACKIDINGAFVRCAFKDPAGFAPDDTSCSTISGAICTVKECDDGVCLPVSPPATVNCGSLPPVQACHANVCALDAQGTPVCVADQLLPAGTVCEVSAGSNDWDCKHFRCSNKGRCRGKRATEGKVCDFAPATTPAAHCNLGLCSAGGSCQDPLFSTLSVVPDMETAALDPAGNPVTANLPTCPSDNNVCTIDRCTGNSDACANLCNVGFDCGVPGVCEGTCQSNPCQCVETP